MDGTYFDDLIRSLTESRRTLLGGALVAAAGLLGVAGTDAKKKRRQRQKKKPKQPNAKPNAKPNAYGCLDVGQPCDGNDATCCSGLCEGTGTQSRCVGHHELGCDADDTTCSASVPCGMTGVCYRTTGKAGFCGDFRVCNCAPCQQDRDCELDFGPGAACIVCTGDCAGVNRSEGTACVPAAP